MLVLVIDQFAKEYLHSDLREIREVMLRKLDGLSEYDIRRPLTSTGTNLLGLVKHLSVSESRYFGEVFGRPFPSPSPGGTTSNSAVPTCGRPSTKHVKRSPAATDASGNTPTGQSLPSPSIRPATCPGGHVLT
jgi:hypothetical protein